MRLSHLLGAAAVHFLAQIQLTTATFCLTKHDANVVANNFAQLLSNFSVPLAEAILANDFTDQSDSANSLVDGGTQSPLPLGSLSFSSKAQNIAAQSSQGNVPFTTLNVWHTCDHVFLRWVSKQHPQQVQGIDIFEVSPQPNVFDWSEYGRYQIKTIYGEFNSVAWIQDAPFNCTVTCPPRPMA
ncbi:hypothetical protein MBLNU457_5172t1 [Dothideomycetes sp. NU457]